MSLLRIINVCSGKGGVGKTTVATNLAAVLNRLGKKVAVVDCNLTTSHLGLHLGVHKSPNSINNYLKNEITLRDAVYTHSSGIHFVPASLDLMELVDVEPSGFKDELKKVFHDFDYVFLDSAPGFGKESLIAMKSSDELLYVATPHIPSLVDIAKYTKLSERFRHKQLGMVINRAKNKKYEIKPDEALYFTDQPILGSVPEDDNVLRSINQKNLVVFSDPRSPSSKAFNKIGFKIAGIREIPRTSVFSGFTSIFRRKKRENPLHGL